MKKGIVTFCGHRMAEFLVTETQNLDMLEKRLQEEILKLFEEYEYISFYIGSQGMFDYMASTVVGKLKKKKKLPCEIVFITSYLGVGKEFANGYFEETIFPPIETVPLRYRILRRNNWMVEQADVLIAYVWDMTGGAAKMYEYAECRFRNHDKPKIINLAK